MVKNNEWVIPKNIEKSVETVYELKGDEYKIPSYEEFMKDYENDESLNYDDLGGGDIGEVKGYGPCSASSCPYSTSFKIKIKIKRGNAWWARIESTDGIDPFPANKWKWSPTSSYLYTDECFELNNITQARNAIRWMEKGWLYTVDFLGMTSSQNYHFKWQAEVEIREAIEKHKRGERVNMEDCEVWVPVYDD